MEDCSVNRKHRRVSELSSVLFDSHYQYYGDKHQLQYELEDERSEGKETECRKRDYNNSQCPPILIPSPAYILISVLMSIVLQELLRLPHLVIPMPFFPIPNSAVPITNPSQPPSHSSHKVSIFSPSCYKEWNITTGEKLSHNYKITIK